MPEPSSINMDKKERNGGGKENYFSLRTQPTARDNKGRSGIMDKSLSDSNNTKRRRCEATLDGQQGSPPLTQHNTDQVDALLSPLRSLSQQVHQGSPGPDDTPTEAIVKACSQLCERDEWENMPEVSPDSTQPDCFNIKQEQLSQRQSHSQSLSQKPFIHVPLHHNPVASSPVADEDVDEDSDIEEVFAHVHAYASQTLSRSIKQETLFTTHDDDNADADTQNRPPSPVAAAAPSAQKTRRKPRSPAQSAVAPCKRKLKTAPGVEMHTVLGENYKVHCEGACGLLGAIRVSFLSFHRADPLLLTSLLPPIIQDILEQALALYACPLDASQYRYFVFIRRVSGTGGGCRQTAFCVSQDDVVDERGDAIPRIADVHNMGCAAASRILSMTPEGHISKCTFTVQVSTVHRPAP